MEENEYFGVLHRVGALVGAPTPSLYDIFYRYPLILCIIKAVLLHKSHFTAFLITFSIKYRVFDFC